MESVSGFNVSTGAGDDLVDFDDPGYEGGLKLVAVEQDRRGEACAEGNCGPRPNAEPLVACGNNDPAATTPTAQYVVPLSSRQLRGFSPVEG